jgi:hypothetical protein
MRSTLLGILVNLGLSATKISAGFVGHSFALVADGLESGADVLGGLVVFFGLKIAVKPPDCEHLDGNRRRFARLDLPTAITARGRSCGSRLLAFVATKLPRRRLSDEATNFFSAVTSDRTLRTSGRQESVLDHNFRVAKNNRSKSV